MCRCVREGVYCGTCRRAHRLKRRVHARAPDFILEKNQRGESGAVWEHNALLSKEEVCRFARRRRRRIVGKP